ncbi:50S ribosome-binding GTPase [Desulfosarcina sp. OttesenSCG-928-A07]|nr:50S ribosome-binding GTPase [Desulfosarcina sp. OttesenSCG-928-G17]MDL2328258.1 50S ribosome-binding GTPase [Desulfosarcina sp. OttesenSCG-928-A07]
MESLYDQNARDAIFQLKQDAVFLADLFSLPSKPEIEKWQAVIESRLLPRLMPHFPLVAAICGGGSSGKSTLFNSLAGESLSPTGGRAGINRRILMGLGAAHQNTPELAGALFEPLGARPALLSHPEDLTTPGNPLLYYAKGLPPNVALMDTPDFDTGAMDRYQNRKMAENALRAADVLIYIFTNASYNNQDNTEFIASLVASVGVRDCFLVYRADPAFSDTEIRNHARTVADHLYKGAGDAHVRGVFRVDEDNRVADGTRPMVPTRVDAEGPGLLDMLSRMDGRAVRDALNQSILKDVIHQAGQFLQHAQNARRLLALYTHGLEWMGQEMARKALAHLSMDAVVTRFSTLWQKSDPKPIWLMRKTGKVVESPLRLMVRAGRWIRRKDRKKTLSPDTRSQTLLQTDLIRAANDFRKAVLDSAIEVQLPDTEPVAVAMGKQVQNLVGTNGVTCRKHGNRMTLTLPFPPALAAEQSALGQEDWSPVIEKMVDTQTELLTLTDDLDTELQELVTRQRSQMTAMDQARQMVSAMLNIIPATAAVTYVLSTGDPVGAVGIKVKLAGLFGLNDLYALVAIPATAGMKKADLKQLETLLAPVMKIWLAHKLAAVENLFETHITGPLLKRGQDVTTRAADRISSMEIHLAQCRRIMENIRP